MVHRPTMKEYEQYLDEVATPEMLGLRENTRNLGAAFRRKDPIAFQVGYAEWATEQMQEMETQEAYDSRREYDSENYDRREY